MVISVRGSSYQRFGLAHFPFTPLFRLNEKDSKGNDFGSSDFINKLVLNLMLKAVITETISSFDSNKGSKSHSSSL